MKFHKKVKIGDQIGNRYRVLNIFKGGMSVVYICYDVENNEVIALKTILKKFLASKFQRDLFKHEGLVWVHLERHPYIIQAKYYINLDSYPFIGLEYIAPDKSNRNSLTHYLKTPIPLHQALEWGIQFCYGMEHARSRGISPHQDIKPDNIMITIGGDIKISDFGIAKLWEKNNTIANFQKIAMEGKTGLTFLRLSKKGKVIGGSVPWMAPEQFEGNADIKSDIYSFGIVLYQLINQGKLPFYYNSFADYKYAHENEMPGRVNSIAFPIIETCLEKKPENRYQDFISLRKDLEKIYLEKTGNIPHAPPKDKGIEIFDLYNKALSLHTLGFPAEAIHAFREVLQLKPNYVDAHNNLGLALKDNGQFDEAIVEFQEALRINSYSLDTRNNLGITLTKKGLYKEAIQVYKENLRIEPYYALGRYYLAKVYDAIGNFEYAISSYKNFIILEPTEELRFKQKINYEKRVKNAKQRIKILEKKVKRKP